MSCVHWDDFLSISAVGCGNGHGGVYERDGFVGRCEGVDAACIARDECLQVVERLMGRECFGQFCEGKGGSEDACRTAAAFFFMDGVRGGVAAEHEFGMAGECCLQECIAVGGAFGDWFAEEVGFEHAACEVVQGDEEVLEGDGGMKVFMGVEQFQCSCGGDVFHADFQLGEAGGEVSVDGQEVLFTVHDEAVAFTMDEEGDAHFFHEVEGGAGFSEVFDAAFAVGGDSGRVEFEAEEERVGERRFEFLPGLVFEEEGHVGPEVASVGGLEDAFGIVLHGGGIGDGRDEVGHDDGSGEGAGRAGGDEASHFSITEVEVHVERCVEGDLHAGSVPDAGEAGKRYFPSARRCCRLPFGFLRQFFEWFLTWRGCFFIIFRSHGT